MRENSHAINNIVDGTEQYTTNEGHKQETLNHWGEIIPSPGVI